MTVPQWVHVHSALHTTEKWLTCCRLAMFPVWLRPDASKALFVVHFVR